MNMKEIFSDILANYDSEVIKLISEKYGFSEMESMRKFLYSETYEMLSDFVYLLEKYAEWKNENAKNILEKWDKLLVTEKIFDMYEMYHIEAIENAFEDIELICAEKEELD